MFVALYSFVLCTSDPAQAALDALVMATLVAATAKMIEALRRFTQPARVKQLQTYHAQLA